jgi:hypothetical protein
LEEMMRKILQVVVMATTLGCATTIGPPTMPLSPGAESVKVLDTKTVAASGVDLSKCQALGQLKVGPVAWNNADVMIKNETLAHGGDVFFGTSWTAGDMTSVTGMAYKCAAH